MEESDRVGKPSLISSWGDTGTVAQRAMLRANTRGGADSHYLNYSKD